MAKRVQVVLSEDILSLGKDGDLVEVAPGYARNFLLPHGKALPVTPAVLKQVEHRRAKEAERLAALNSISGGRAAEGRCGWVPLMQAWIIFAETAAGVHLQVIAGTVQVGGHR